MTESGNNREKELNKKYEIIFEFQEIIKLQDTMTEKNDSAIGLDGRDIERSLAFFQKGMSYFQSKQFGKVVQEFSKLLDMSSSMSDKIPKITVFIMRGFSYDSLGEYEKSIEDYNEVINLNKLHFKAFFFRGNANFQLGNYENAEVDYSEAIRLSPQFFHARNSRGKSLFELKKYKKSIVDFSEVIRINSKYFEAYYNRGNSNYMLGEFELAIRDFSLAMSHNPRHYQSFENRGIVYNKLEEYEKAINDYNHAIEINPNNSVSFFNRGNSLSSLKLFGRAIDDYTEAIRIQPKYHSAYFNRGFVYTEIEDFQKSLEDYVYCIKLDSTDYASFNNLGKIYYKTGEYEKALSHYHEAVKINPRFVKAIINLGITNCRIERYKLGIEYYTKAISINPDDYETFHRRGLARYQNNDFQGGIEDFSSAIRINPKTHESFNNRGQCSFKLGLLENSIADFTEAIRLYPEYYQAYYNRGNVYFKIKYLNRAVEEYSCAIKINPKFHLGYNNRGSCYQILRKYDLAKKDFLSSIKFNISYERSLCNLADLFIEIGELEKSQKYFKEAIDRNPSLQYVYARRIESLTKIDEERAIEDFSRLIQFYEKQGKDPVIPWSEREIQEKVEKIFQTLETKTHEKNIWFPFLNDKHNDEHIEKEEIEKQKNELTRCRIIGVSSINMKDMKVFRFLGKGAFCRTYLCRIFGINGIFVMKMAKRGVFSPEDELKMKKMVKRDCLDIPYHRNIAVVFSRSDDDFQTVDVQKFPDKNYWKENEISLVKTPIILMKYYRKDLRTYVKERKKDNAPFQELEICFMMMGLLRGVSHLQKNMIIHRDLHEENVFVDEAYGRIFIGDFGCSLDLRNNKNGFLVKNDMKIVQTWYYSAFKLKKGGRKMYLAPEILDFDETKKEYLDFSKCDIFSVGMCGYFSVSSFYDGFTPFGIEDDGYFSRKQKDYVDLKCDGKISKFIRRLLMVKLAERIGCEEAVFEIDKLISFFLTKNDDTGV